MTKQTAFTRVLIVASVAASLGVAARLHSQPEYTPPTRMTGWLNLHFQQAVAELVGPQGAQIYPIWNRDGNEVSFEGILLQMPADLDLGLPSHGQLNISFDSTNLLVSSIEFIPDEPARRDALERTLGVQFEIRYCKPTLDDPVEDSPMELTSKGDATYTFGLVAQLRLKAELDADTGQVMRLEWIGSNRPLEGCL